MYYNREGVQIELLEWGRLLEQEHYRLVEFTEVGAVHVSTVWLGLDHAMGNTTPPLIFETMIFGGELDEKCQRYATLEEAKAGHDRWVRVVEADGDRPEGC
jgi:hypothetical protein